MGLTVPAGKGKTRERVDELRRSGVSKRKAKRLARQERHPNRVGPVTRA